MLEYADIRLISRHYLTKQFGEYMQLPPKNQRIDHGNGAIIDLHKSYRVYQQGIGQL